jgi:Spx/MgsR family transcriptional regulator
MENTPIKLYGIAACDTVKRARAWLDAHHMAHDFHDFKKLGVPADQLDRWLAEVGRERLLNTRGTTWRKLDETVRAAVVDDASARALMLAQPSVIKRPVVQWGDGRVSVGFDANAWPIHADGGLP